MVESAHLLAHPQHFEAPDPIQVVCGRAADLVTKEHGKSLADSSCDFFRGYEVVEHACSFGSLNQGETT